MSKRFKYIEEKTDNQLNLIRDQGDKQLDKINRITFEKIDGAKFSIEKSKRLGDKIRKKSKENDNKKYMYTTTNNTPFNFGEYNIRLMGSRFSTRDLTLDEAKDEQETMPKKIEAIKSRANPKRGRVKIENKKSIKEVIKNAEDLYETRRQIINILEGKEETEDESNLYWLHRPKKELEDLIKNIKIDVNLEGEDHTKIMKKDLESFVDNIMAGKINNEKTAREEYIKNFFDYKKTKNNSKNKQIY